ncbi:MAG TPA: hypothetical protein VN371_06225 [Chlorobaculum sp.]|nr:hypothetical protein [Chlorobaculum sp.]
MANTPVKPGISAASVAEKIQHIIPIWDPVPDWARLDEKKLAEFGKLQIQSKLKELELQKAKLEHLAKII